METGGKKDGQKEGVVESRPGRPVENEERYCDKPKRRLRALAYAFSLLVAAAALALAFVMKDKDGGKETEGFGSQAFEVPLDDIAAEMIAGFDGFSFAVTNGQHVVHVGNFSAKRVSAVDGRVRVNFNAVAYEAESGGRWETSVLIEFSLASNGSRLKGDGIAVRRIHIYDLPKTVGNDELEYDPRVVSIVKARLQSSKEVVSESQKIVEVKLTTDDVVKISWENIK